MHRSVLRTRGRRARSGIESDGDGTGTAGGIEFALEPLEIAAKIGGGLVAKLPIFFKRFADDAFEFRRKIRIQAKRRDRQTVHDGFKNDCGAFAAEWKLAGCHLVEDHAER